MSGDLTDSGPGRSSGERTAPGNRDGLARCPRAARAVAALLALAAQPALAAPGFSPFATIGYEYDSNVFMRPSGSGAGIGGLGDSELTYEAGLGETLDWGPQKLTFDAEGTRDQYHRFSYLNHYDYSFGGNLDWRLGPVVDGFASYRQRRFMAEFINTFTTALLVDTEKEGSVTARVLVTPEWRLDLTPELHELDTPLADYPGFKVVEKIGTAGLNYLGFGKLTAGVQFTDNSGRYEGITGATRYQQHEADLTVDYKVSGLSSFAASAGYAKRSSEANAVDSVPAPGGGAFNYGSLGETSSVTGTLSYHRQVTAKTSASLSLFRRIDSYSAGANPEVGTGGAFGLTWKVDPKISMNLNYDLTHDQIQGGLVVVNVPNLNQRMQSAEFEVRYQALPWLVVRPYVNWSKESSNFTLVNYSATIVGIDVTARPPP